MKRRDFVVGSGAVAAGIAIGSPLPGSWMQTLASELSPARDRSRILVVIQLSGGNDGLNTVVPFNNDAYIKARPTLRVAKSDIVRINDSLGLHPSLVAAEKLLSSKRFCAVQGVGYANPNRSHFESMDIWHTCSPKTNRSRSGWLGRTLVRNQDDKQHDAPGLHLGGEPLPLAFVEKGLQIPSLATVDQLRLKNKSNSQMMENEAAVESKGQDDAHSELLSFVATSTTAALEASKRLESALASPDSAGDFPASGLGEKLKIVSRLILAGLTTQVYYVTLDGFDTHSNQATAHSGLLRQWMEALTAFTTRLEQAGEMERVLVMTFSEFGRRVAENASNGTDHGAAAPMYFAGPKFDNPIYGDLPSLSDLDDGDLKFHTDFRSVYATVVEKWLGLQSKDVLGSQYPLLNLFS